MRLIAMLAILIASTALAQPDQITERGHQVPKLVESYLKGQDGKPFGGDDAWPLIQDLTKLVWSIVPNNDAPKDTRVDFRSLCRASTEEARQRAVEAMRKLDDGGMPALLDRMKNLRRFVPPAQAGAMLDWRLPELGAVRHAAQAEAARMKMAADRWDGQAIALSFERIMALGRLMSFEPQLTGRVVSISVMGRGMEMLRDLMRAGRCDEECLRACAEVMDRQFGRAPPSLTFEGDRIFRLDMVDSVYRLPPAPRARWIVEFGAGKKATAQMTDEVIEVLLTRMAGGRIATESEAREFIEAQLTQIVAVSKLPPREMLHEARKIREGYAQLPKSQALWDASKPDVLKAAETLAEDDALVVGTRAMIAIELFHAQKGSHPERLQDLVPAYLKEPPEDAYTGEPLRYRRFQPGEDELGRGYLLYSVGVDGVDDGGKVHDEGAGAASSVKGFDLVLNAPQSK